MTLQKYYDDLIETVDKYIARFVFKFKGKYYLAEFRKLKWQEPREILFIRTLGK